MSAWRSMASLIGVIAGPSLAVVDGGGRRAGATGAATTGAGGPRTRRRSRRRRRRSVAAPATTWPDVPDRPSTSARRPYLSISARKSRA